MSIGFAVGAFLGLLSGVFPVLELAPLIRSRLPVVIEPWAGFWTWMLCWIAFGLLGGLIGVAFAAIPDRR